MSATQNPLAKIMGNPELLDKIDKAKTHEERRRILHQAGLTENTDPTVVRNEVVSLLKRHGKTPKSDTAYTKAATEQGMSDVGIERPVEWVAALATLAVAAL